MPRLALLPTYFILLRYFVAILSLYKFRGNSVRPRKTNNASLSFSIVLVFRKLFCGSWYYFYSRTKTVIFSPYFVFLTNDLLMFESTYGSLWISFISILISMTYLEYISVTLYHRLDNSYLLPTESSMGFGKLSLRILRPPMLIVIACSPRASLMLRSRKMLKR